MELNCSIQILDELEQYKSFYVDNLTIKLPSSNSIENVIDKLLTKFPYVTKLNYKSYIHHLHSISALQNMKRLKNASVKYAVSSNDFSKLLSQLSHNLESLEVECRRNEMKKIGRFFIRNFHLLH